MVIVWRLMAGCVAGHVLEGFDVLGKDQGGGVSDSVKKGEGDCFFLL